MLRTLNPLMQASLADIDAYHILQEIKLTQEVAVIKQQYLRITLAGNTI